MIKTAEYYVRLFVENYAVVAYNDELAVLGPHLNGMLVDFLGEIPQSSNFKSDAVGWRAERMRQVSEDFYKSLQLLRLCTEKQRRALIYWAYYKDRLPDGAEKRLYSKESVARYLCVDATSFYELIQRGEDRINAELGLMIC